MSASGGRQGGQQEYQREEAATIARRLEECRALHSTNFFDGTFLTSELTRASDAGSGLLGARQPSQGAQPLLSCIWEGRREARGAATNFYTLAIISYTPVARAPASSQLGPNKYSVPR